MSDTFSAQAGYEAAAYDRFGRSHQEEDLTTRPEATALSRRFDPVHSTTESEQGHQPREDASSSSSGSRSAAEPMIGYPDRRPAFLPRRNSDTLAAIRRHEDTPRDLAICNIPYHA